MGRLQLVSQCFAWPEGIEFIWVRGTCQARLPGFKCNSMHILSSGSLLEWTGEEPKGLPDKALRAGHLAVAPAPLSPETYLKGMAVCCEVHPTLGTEPQNILTDGMYFVILVAVGAVRPNT